MCVATNPKLTASDDPAEERVGVNMAQGIKIKLFPSKTLPLADIRSHIEDV